VNPVAELTGLTVSFHGIPVVRGVTLALAQGETLGLVGESGSGKTMIGLSLLQLVPPPGQTRGSVRVLGHELVGAHERELRELRGAKVAMVFQDPMTALNPVRTIGSMLVESAHRHQRLPRAQARAAAVAALRRAGVPAPQERLSAYPHMLSGGLRQRAMIALALVNAPALLVADEPTTALDATIQAQLLDMLSRIDSTVLLITHDLAVAADLCDRIAVVYSGRIVETGPTLELLATPRHPYTQALIAARPHLDGPHRLPRPIPGQPPPPGTVQAGCPFRPRCPLAGPECTMDPPLTNGVACWKANPG
jgi:oligopeptide/dipeptide ABC transporter ATP-binding protein